MKNQIKIKFVFLLAGLSLSAAVMNLPIAFADGGSSSSHDNTGENVIQKPWSTAILPLAAIDGNTGFTLLIESPIFNRAFAEELEGNDRPFMKMAAEALTSGNQEALWNGYEDRFSSREEFEQALQHLDPMISSSKENTHARIQMASLDEQGVSFSGAQ